MNKTKKIVVLLLVMALAFAETMSGVVKNVEAKSSKLKLSTKSINVCEGKSKNVSISGKNAKKVKWSISSGKKHIKLKKNGKKVKITGVSLGNSVVVAKVGKKKLKLNVYVVKCFSSDDTEETTTEELVLNLSESTKELTKGLVSNGVALPSTDATFAYDVSDFSINTLRTVRSLKKDKRVLVSPNSIATAMAMVTNGADGNTKAELMKMLAPNMSLEDYNKYLSGMNNRLNNVDQLIYQVSDSIWIKDTDKLEISEDFLKDNYNYYNAEVYKAAFDKTTLDDVNSWVNVKTRKMIPKILNDISDDARMFLINTVAFEGQWAEQYKDYQINKEEFTNSDGAKEEATFLNDELGAYYKISDRLAFERYYKGGEIKFVGILPNDGETVDDVIASMDGKAFVDGLDKCSYADVYTKIPKFTYDYDINLNETFNKLGVVEAYGENANFSKMTTPTSTEKLVIGDVFHKTHIELDENGTKAAAVTAVVMNKNTSINPSIPREQVFIYLDRPFIYALVDSKTNIPLFIGTVESLK